MSIHTEAAALDFGQVYHSFEQLSSGVLIDKLRVQTNPFTSVPSNVRPNSASVEDFGFGDAGKGHVIQEINHSLIEGVKASNTGNHVESVLRDLLSDGRKVPITKRVLLVSSRFNGSDNAGHEIVENGQKIALHQLPIAVTQEDALGVIAKGGLVHPTNLVTEIKYVSNKLGGDLKGELFIDQNVVVVTDLQRAFEGFTNQLLDVGGGATGSGIAQGYSMWYEKRAITMRDFMSDEWEEGFRRQYRYYATLFGGEEQLRNIEVFNLNENGERDKVKVGTEDEFIDKLRSARSQLEGYVGDWASLLREIWRDPAIPLTFEGAQADGLDPYHGVYPDVTASRPIGRIGIPDSTEGIVDYDQLAVTLGVGKIPYFSSVGSRKPPYGLTREEEEHYREANNEFGRSTGRPRGILPPDMALFQYTQRVGRKKHIGFTHADSAVPTFPAKVVTRYVDKSTGKPAEYRPHQWHWDTVKGVIEDFPSWNGDEAAQAKEVSRLPKEALVYLAAYAETVGVKPIVVTNGPKKGDVIFFFNQ